VGTARRIAGEETLGDEIEQPEIAEILKVMTESLPIKLLSPLGPELMKLL
jgi:hypothetical protein